MRFKSVLQTSQIIILLDANTGTRRKKETADPNFPSQIAREKWLIVLSCQMELANPFYGVVVDWLESSHYISSADDCVEWRRFFAQDLFGDFDKTFGIVRVVPLESVSIFSPAIDQ